MRISGNLINLASFIFHEHFFFIFRTSFLERVIRVIKTPTGSVHPFAWIHGLACISRGNLDAGFANLHAFLQAVNSSDKPFATVEQAAMFPDFGVVSGQYVNRLIIHLDLLVGNTEPADKNVTRDVDGEMCTNRGDSIPSIKADEGIKQECNQLPIYMPALSRQRLDALNKLSKYVFAKISISTCFVFLRLTNFYIALPFFGSRWDNENIHDKSIEPRQPNTSSNLIEHLENLLLSYTCDESNSSVLQEISAVIRQTYIAVSSQHRVQTSNDLKYLPSECSLSDIVLKTEAVLGDRKVMPDFSAISLANWTSRVKSSDQLRTSTVLTACESLLLRLSTRQGVVDGPIEASKLVVTQMLCNEARILNLTALTDSLQVPADYLSLVQVTNQKNSLTYIDRLRMIRCLGSLLWVRSTDGGSLLDKVTAMNCLAQGLRRSVVETLPDREQHARHCLLNASVALQLFNFLETSSSSTRIKSKKLTTCEGLFESTMLTEIDSDQNLTEVCFKSNNLSFFSLVFVKTNYSLGR